MRTFCGEARHVVRAIRSTLETKLLSELQPVLVSELFPEVRKHLLELLQGLEPAEWELSSSEIFAVLFELELAGKVRQLPGKNFVKTF